MRKRSKNGNGTTSKRGSSYRTTIKANGRTYTATAKTALESRELAKARVRNSPVSRIQSSSVPSRMKFGLYLETWLENEHRARIAHGTYLRYLGLLKSHIAPLIGNFYLEELSPRVISLFMAELSQKGLGGRSLQQTKVLISMSLHSAEEQELILDNPARKVRNPQYRSPQIEPINIDDVRRLLNTFEGTLLSARLHLALLCGLRQGEALGLQWSDINWNDKFIKITKQMQSIDGKRKLVGLKTPNSNRVVFLTDETVKVLKRHQELLFKTKSNATSWTDIDLLFPGANGLPIAPKTDYKNWQRALALTGLEAKRLHDARHTAATLMYSQGVGIETISRALGHSSSAITSKLYVHSAEEPLRQVAEALQSMLID